MLGAQKYQGHVNYTLAEKKDGYEIRQYFPYFQAELSVAAPYYSQALSKGADELNRYVIISSIRPYLTHSQGT
jgi:hypothetical protein